MATPTDLARVCLVGETNPYGADPQYALYALPFRASGDRMRRILGLSMPDYHALTRVNLCEGKWSMKAARATCERVYQMSPRVDVVVMLGSKVRAAFGMSALAFFERSEVTTPDHVSLPHPSGLNRMWNEPFAIAGARRVMSLAAPWVEWGAESYETLDGAP